MMSVFDKLKEKYKSYSFGEDYLFINADCLEVLKDIDNESIDCILTDPPFMIRVELKIRRGMNKAKFKGKDIVVGWDWDSDWGNIGVYVKWVRMWLKECVRVLKDYRHLLFFFDKAKVSFVWYYLERLGMEPRQPLFYICTNPVPPARGVNFANSVSEILWFTKKEVKRDYFNWQEGIHPDYYFAPKPLNSIDEYGRIHPTQKPIDLLEWILRYLSKPNDIVLDPFAGSFSTAIACYNLGRRFIGIEKNDEYFNKAIERFKERIKQMELFER